MRVINDRDVLVRLARAGKVEIVLASSLNGLARSSSELVQLLKEFLSRNIVLIIPSLRLDTSKVSSKAFLDVLDAIEEFKGAAATESIRAGLTAAKARGVKLGRPQLWTVRPCSGCGPAE